jgi:F-type H+-transporting ATPase subunit alpha
VDDLALEQVQPFLTGLREYLRVNKPGYSKAVRTEKTLTPEAEALLKEGITEYKASFTA